MAPELYEGERAKLKSPLVNSLLAALATREVLPKK